MTAALHPNSFDAAIRRVMATDRRRALLLRLLARHAAGPQWQVYIGARRVSFAHLSSDALEDLWTEVVAAGAERMAVAAKGRA